MKNGEAGYFILPAELGGDHSSGYCFLALLSWLREIV